MAALLHVRKRLTGIDYVLVPFCWLRRPARYGGKADIIPGLRRGGTARCCWLGLACGRWFVGMVDVTRAKAGGREVMVRGVLVLRYGWRDYVVIAFEGGGWAGSTFSAVKGLGAILEPKGLGPSSKPSRRNVRAGSYEDFFGLFQPLTVFSSRN